MKLIKFVIYSAAMFLMLGVAQPSPSAQSASLGGEIPAASVVNSSEQPASKNEKAASNERASINSGDKLSIQVYQEPDLSGSFTVDTSGEINYPLLGDVYSQGLSLDELKAFVEGRLGTEYLVNPQVKIEFEESPNKSVSVLGQIIKPGNYIYTPNLSLIKLMSQVGGFTSEALTEDIKIVRSDPDGKKTTIPVNMDKIIKEAGSDFILEPGDIIYVEKNRLNIMGQIGAGKEDVESPKAFITILGQVATPGNYHLTKDVTLIRLIGQAGGFTPVAATSRVKIVRSDFRGGKQKVIMVNAGKIMDGRSEDVKLEAGDLITIPESYF